MRRQVIPTIGLALSAVVTWFIRLHYFSDVSGYGAYAIVTLCWITTMMTIVMALHLLSMYLIGSRSRSQTKPIDPMHWSNRRRSFRIVYGGKYHRPTIVVEASDNQPRRQLTYRVADLSEEGLCFIDDGSLGISTRLVGFIRWSTGNESRIAGTVVRRHDQRISIRLDARLNQKSIYHEQRLRLQAERRSQSKSAQYKP